MEGNAKKKNKRKKGDERVRCWRAGLEEAVETEINEKLADEKFVESLNVSAGARHWERKW
jgi:hypothetical protein